MKAQISIVAVEFSGVDTTVAENVSTVPVTSNPFGPASIDSPLNEFGVTGEMGVKWRKSLEIALENISWLRTTDVGGLSSTPVT
jgi:hypothetical protein